MGTFTGTPGDDNLPGTGSNDSFILTQGGEDSATGQGGDDIFHMGGALDAGDNLDGGTGNDQIFLRGDYSAGVTFGATTVTNVERIALGGGFDYKLTTDDATVAAGQTLTVDASALASGHALNFDGTAETDGHFRLVDGAGDDVLKGGDGGDTFDLRAGGGEDSVTGGSGGDVILVGGSLDAGDRIDGGFSFGLAHDVLRFAGDYSAGLTLAPDTVQNIYTLQFGAGHDYKITVDNANFLSGPAVTVRADALGAGNFLNFDGSASDANFRFTGGAGNDVLTGGTATDYFDLSHGGNDTASGGDLHDLFVMGATLTAADTIDGGSGSDTVELSGMGLSDAIILGATTLTSVETLLLDPGHIYTLVTGDANVAAGATLLVAGNYLGAGDNLTFDGAAETDGHFILRGGAGDDQLTGGALSDTFNLTVGGEDQVDGQGGNDLINMGASLDSDDGIDGGAGNDTMTMNGVYDDGAGGPFTIFSSMFTSVETLQLQGAHDYNLQLWHGLNGNITIDATAIAANAVSIDGSFATGNLTFEMGAGFDANDSLAGGAGSDALNLDGDYSAGVIFDGDTLTNVETMVLAAGHSYKFTTNDATVAAGQSMTVDASALAASDTLTFDGSAETDGKFTFDGGAGDDVIAGGNDGDTYNLNLGGNDTATGGTGNDFFVMNGALTAADKIDGGAGFNQMTLDGDYSGGLVLGATTLLNIQSIAFGPNHSYNLTTNDATVAPGATFNVNASALLAGDQITFNGAAETDGVFTMTGGAGNDALTGGALADGFDLTHGGSDTVHGGGGDDTINFGATLTSADSIDGGGGNDTVGLSGAAYGNFSISTSFLTSVDTLQLTGSSAFGFKTTDASIASRLTIDGSALTAALTVDTTRTGAGGGTNGLFTLEGGAGNDTFAFGSNLSSGDILNGGAGSDTLSLNGTYPLASLLVLGATSFSSVEKILLLGQGTGNTYMIVENDGNVAAGQTLTVDGSATITLGINYIGTINFDGSHETDGAFAFIGGAINNTLIGGAQADSFDLTHSSSGGLTAGGNDHVTGNGGNDTISFGATLTASDSVDGGAGSDSLSLDGDYSAGVTFNASTVVNVETLTLAAGHSYKLITNDATVASGATLTVDASALGAADSITFNGSAETNGAFTLKGGAGDDVLTGGAQNDGFNLTQGGNDTASGGAGNDTFSFGAAFTAADTVNGGGNTDTISLNGDYSAGLVLGAATLTSVEDIVMQAGHDYNLTTADANVATGTTLVIDASALGSSDSLTFDGSAEASGTFEIFGGHGADTLTGGAGIDDLRGGNGADLLDGGGGAGGGLGGGDFYTYNQISDSTGIDHDTIVGFNATFDVFSIGAAGFDGTVTGSVSTASFDADIGAAAGGGATLHAGDAWLVQATGGTLSGHTFVVVDENGDAHYTAGSDYVIDITGFTGTMTSANFE